MSYYGMSMSNVKSQKYFVKSVGHGAERLPCVASFCFHTNTKNKSKNISSVFRQIWFCTNTNLGESWNLVSVLQQPQRREVVLKPGAVKKTKMFEEMKQKMSEGMEGAKEQVWNISQSQLSQTVFLSSQDRRHESPGLFTTLTFCRLLIPGARWWRRWWRGRSLPPRRSTTPSPLSLTPQ